MVDQEYRLTSEAWKALKEPFKPEFIQWRPVRFNHERTRALVVPFYDARHVVVRLDAIVGPENWQVSHEPLPGGGLMTAIGIRIGDSLAEGWVFKADVGYIDRDTDRDTGEKIAGATKIKGDASDGLKRAGVMWGIGRVYWMIPRSIKDEFWVDWDNNAKKMKGDPPVLPSWALPYPIEPEKPAEGDTEPPESGEKPEEAKKPPKPAKVDEPLKRPYDAETLKKSLAQQIKHFEKTGETVSKTRRGIFHR
ncbi:unnamed protein product, partial [marine sediment metagenome]